MNFEPQKFFIGLMDFFSILLPGALLTYLLMDQYGPVVLGDCRYMSIEGAEGWAAFLLASYLFGHLIFLLGSLLDWLYDRLRICTLNKQIKRMAYCGCLMPWIVRVVVWLVFKRERDLAVECAEKLRKNALTPLKASNTINTFQWCKVVLSSDKTEHLAVVQRFEADSKFFRCLAVVLFLMPFVWSPERGWSLAGYLAVLAMLIMALWRYMEQRLKATNQAYWSVIALMAKDSNAKRSKQKSSTAAGNVTRAGGVVFRMRGGDAEYLLVTAKDKPCEWVLPKGHIEDGEDPCETAVREVHEETGFWGRIKGDLNTVMYMHEGKLIKNRVYLMEYVGRGMRKAFNRKRRWFPLKKAIKTATHPETKKVLKTADQHRQGEDFGE